MLFSFESALSHILHFPFWLGDAVMAIPFAHTWMEHHRGKRRILVIDPSLRELIGRCNFSADLWVHSKKERDQLYIRLKLEAPSSVTLLTNSWGSILPYWKAKVPQRIGFGGPMTRYMLTQRGPRAHLSRPQGERWFSLIGREPSPNQPPTLLDVKWDEGATPHLLLFPGAKYGPAKQWDAPSYAKVIETAQKMGWKVSLLGTPDEQKDAESILALLEQPVENLCGRFKLGQLLDHIATLARPVALANDSGAMHLLAAAGVPTVGLYFSTSASNTPPAFGPATVLEAEVPCRPCYERQCPKGHYNCRRAIQPEMVIEALEHQL